MTTTLPLPPGPIAQFPFGHLRELREDRLGFWRMCVHAYGDCVTLMFGPNRSVLVTDPNLIEQVLVTQSRSFIKNRLLRMNRILLGDGLLTSEGDFWLRQRRLSQPAFHRARVMAYGETMVTSTKQMLANWRDGEERDAHQEMMQLTLEIVAKTLFDVDASREGRDVAGALSQALASFDARINSLQFLLPERVPTPLNIRAWRAIERLDKVIYAFIERGRASGCDGGDLLSMLLHAQDDDGSRMTDQQLRDEVMTLFLAGYDTTALALSWIWYLLGQHPEVEARLVTEIQTILGEHPPTLADLPRLPYAEMIVQEGLRLYPPAYVIGREATEDCEIGGYLIPKGTTVLMSQWLMQRDGRYFPQPEVFKPERWADGLARRLPKYAYFPFGGGQRACIGSVFAMMEAVLLLVTIAQRFRLELVPGYPVEPKTSFTLRPRNGVKVVLRKR